MAKLEVRNLRKEFDTPQGIEIAVDDISFEVEKDEFLTLVGPSGCGKTTTLRCIAGLETPTSGEILLDGEPINNIPPNKRDISMMFQSIALYPHMTVRQNIAYPLKVNHISKEDQKGPVEDVAELMQISDMLDKHPGDLSGGQRQRAALARTVIQDPELFLMDEPLSDLDAKLKKETRKEILKIHRRVKKSIMYVTHDQEEAMTMSDKMAVLNDGGIEQFGPPQEIFHKPNSIFIGQFIGSHGMNIVDGEITNNELSNILSLDEYGYEIELPEQSTQIDPNTVKVGFRPEFTQINTNGGGGGIEGTVELLETFGSETVATVNTSTEEQLLAVADSTREISEGMNVKITPNKNKIHLFDPESGDILVHLKNNLLESSIS
jgi:multiple sugar transport system ATP-binding protein